MNNGCVVKIYAKDKNQYYLSCYRPKYVSNRIIIRPTESLKMACEFQANQLEAPIFQSILNKYMHEIIPTSMVGGVRHFPIKLIPLRSGESYMLETDLLD